MDARPFCPSIVFTVFFLCVLSGPVAAQGVTQDDWPQFRGADGRAVAAETHLPAKLDPASTALRWKTPIRGSGNSSPIVSKGQVFLTTAYEGQDLSSLRSYTNIGMLVLGVLALLAIARRLWGKPAVHTHGITHASRLFRVLSWIDRGAVFLATIGFAGIATVATLDTSMLWSSGVPGDIWLITGATGLVGLFAAFGWSSPRSVGRAFAAIVLLCAACYLYQYLPLNKHHAVYRLSVRLGLVAPGVLGAIWFLLLFRVFRRHGGAAAGPRGPGAAVAGLAIAGATLLLFASCNFINPAAGQARAILALDLATGRQLWDTPLFEAPEERLDRRNSFATPTPCAATDGEHILAFFGPGWACVDRKGSKLWAGRDDRYMEQSHYGAVSSPIPFEDTFIVLHETEQTDKEYSYVMALDVRTGKERWKINPTYAHESYMTPLLKRIGGATQLITVTFGRVVAYDPCSGEKLWELELPTWQHVPSLTHEGDLVFVAGGAHMKWVTAAVRVMRDGKATKPEVVWQSTRNVPNAASPVCYGGMLFTVKDGIMVCYDAMTGKRHWRQRLGGTYLASLVAGDGKVYACSEEGDVTVVAARPVYQELSRASLGEAILATPAIAQGNVLIRTREHVYCFRASR